MQTTIILQGKEAKMWAMLKVLDSLGFFEITYGKAIISFDGEGKISNIEITKNYRLPTLPTSQTMI
jgi:hypothetical protein